ncbi:MAG TPA: site-2 protease family protein [Solirubrobacteraceae bacterium]|nr:site-2 protease family protein [Solirubrobacteraceae bacterium]
MSGPVRMRNSIQLMRVFGIRIGVSASWFVVLGFLIYFFYVQFHESIAGSQSTVFLLAVIGTFGYFASILLHELGHALVSRRLGIPVLGIELWFFGGMARQAREPETSGEEFKVAAAGPAVTFVLLVLFAAATQLLGSSEHVSNALLSEGGKISPGLALLWWLAAINALLLFFNLIPAFPLDGGRIARAAIWWRTGDRHRGTRLTGRAGQALALALGIGGLLLLADGGEASANGVLLLVLGLLLYQASGGAVMQGVLGQRIQRITVGDIMDREPTTIPAELRLLDAQEQFFARYREPWFAVVDQARHLLGVVRSERVDQEIAAGRPALQVGEVLEQDLPVRISAQEPLESLLRSEGLGRLGGMVAVDTDDVVQGVVTVAQIRQALNPAAGR